MGKMKRGSECFLVVLLLLTIVLTPITIAKSQSEESSTTVLIKKFSQVQPPVVLMLALVASDTFGNFMAEVTTFRIFGSLGKLLSKAGFRLTGSVVTLPQAFVDTSLPTQTGQTLTVNAGGNLQTAINSAQPGDTIVLQQGATFTGNFNLPNKANPQNKWIIITTSGANNLPPPGQRINPANDAQYMAKISTINSQSAISTASGANGYRFIGIEFTAGPGTSVNDLVSFGAWGQTTNAMPYNIIVDRSWIHGCATCSMKNGVTFHTGSSAIVDSRVEDIHWIGVESHGIHGGNGVGPHKIENNYVDAASINLLWGGSTHTVTGHPLDMEIKKNYFNKSLTYMGKGFSVKNDFELKVGERVLVEGNIFENSWVDGQIGYGVVLKSPESNPAVPGWRAADVTKDITFRNNILRNVAGGISFSEGAKDILIENNVLELAGNLGTNGRIFVLDGCPGCALPALSGIEISHNDAFGGTHSVLFGSAGVVTSGLIIKNNIINKATYGLFSSSGMGSAALNYASPTGWTFLGNVIFGSSITGYPTGNNYPTSSGAVGFTNYNNGIRGDYTLTSSSPYKNSATDGTDPGVNVATLNQATSGVISGIWGGSCTDTTWTPATNTRCGTFTQISNCGNTRSISGTLTCGGSTPVCSSSNVCVQCTQSSQCSLGQTCTNNICVTPVPAPGPALILGYNFSENSGTTTADYSGNGRTGTLTGTSWVPGKTGSALSFDGTSSRVVSSDIPNPSSITMEAWIYPTTVGERVVIAKTTAEYDARIIGSPVYRMQMRFGTALLRDNGLDFSNTSNFNQWYHYAFTYDNSTGDFKLYRNGVLVNSGNSAGVTATDSGELVHIGRHPTGVGTFAGIIDDIRIWNSALTQSQIIADMGGLPCVDTMWSPSPTNLCGIVTQLSDCGNTRLVTGSVQCTTSQTCITNICVNIPSPTNNTTIPPVNNTTIPPVIPPSTGGGGGGGGGGSSIPTSRSPSIIQKKTIGQASPTLVNILRDFSPDTGVRHIEIIVVGETQSIGITVSKYENVPEAVSVKKPGRVYKYLQIESQNLSTNLATAIINSQVEKSWIQENHLSRDDIALFKFNETSKEWMELPTTFSEEDSTNFYYNTEIQSFSYFLIGQKATPLDVFGAKIVIALIILIIILSWILFLIVVRSRKHAMPRSPHINSLDPAPYR